MRSNGGGVASRDAGRGQKAKVSGLKAKATQALARGGAKALARGGAKALARGGANSSLAYRGA